MLVVAAMVDIVFALAVEGEAVIGQLVGKFTIIERVNEDFGRRETLDLIQSPGQAAIFVLMASQSHNYPTGPIECEILQPRVVIIRTTRQRDLGY